MAIATASVRLDADVVKALKIVAAEEGTSIRALIEIALYEHYKHRARPNGPAGRLTVISR